MPGRGTIFGVPADVAVRVGLTILAGTLSSAAVVVVAIDDEAPIASILAVSGGLLGVSLACVHAIREDQDRRALEQQLARLEAINGAA